ncbi:MAG: hypothetical protein CR967_02720 [Proteobacteria bacterium]|nr:MAG: hypothetical protein CR967_02720 [Pseudomonadota bacterium]
MNELLNSEIFTLYIIPVLICIARILDVSIGTLRIIFISKSYKFLAMILGFFESMIWIIAISEVMKNLDNFVNILAYATGYSLGNFIGILIENRLAIGVVVMRIITKKDSSELVNFLRSKNYNTTAVEAEGNLGAVSVIFLNLKRSHVKNIIPIIHKFNPLATYTIEDIRHVSDPLVLDTNKSKWNFKGKLPRFRK